MLQWWWPLFCHNTTGYTNFTYIKKIVFKMQILAVWCGDFCQAFIPSAQLISKMHCIILIAVFHWLWDILWTCCGHNNAVACLDPRFGYVWIFAQYRIICAIPSNRLSLSLSLSIPLSLTHTHTLSLSLSSLSQPSGVCGSFCLSWLCYTSPITSSFTWTHQLHTLQHTRTWAHLKGNSLLYF